MSKTTKRWLYTAVVLILIGGILFTGMMAALDWDFKQLSTQKFVTNNYEITQPFSNISVIADTADVTFVPSEGAVSVSCCEPEKMTHAVMVKDDTLVIEVVNEKEWYDHLIIGFESPQITVSLPKQIYGALTIRSATGDISLSKDFSFESVSIKLSTGDILMENVSADTMELSVTTGCITAQSVDCAKELNIHVTTGDAKVYDTRCGAVISDGSTGDLLLKNVVAEGKLSLERSTGDITLDSCDAAELFIQTSTGDVDGTLRSQKTFMTQTSTGDVSVPQTTTGGICEITTSTGDITMRIHS